MPQQASRGVACLREEPASGELEEECLRQREQQAQRP